MRGDNGTQEIRGALFARLSELGIVVEVLPYPAHDSVEQGKALRGDMAGTFTKNLLLKDKKRRHFLLSIHEDRNLDLKSLHKRLGAKGQLGFASPERVEEYLRVIPGALTPLGLINDSGGAVTTVIDASLMEADQLNFHPLVSTESVGLRPNELVEFVRSCDREPMIVDFDLPLPE